MKEHIATMYNILNEQDRRIFLASVANELGHGGVKRVCEIGGASPHTVIKGKKEIKQRLEKTTWQRAKGECRKKTESIQPKTWE